MTSVTVKWLSHIDSERIGKTEEVEASTAKRLSRQGLAHILTEDEPADDSSEPESAALESAGVGPSEVKPDRRATRRKTVSSGESAPENSPEAGPLSPDPDSP